MLADCHLFACEHYLAVRPFSTVVCSHSSSIEPASIPSQFGSSCLLPASVPTKLAAPLLEGLEALMAQPNSVCWYSNSICCADDGREGKYCPRAQSSTDGQCCLVAAPASGSEQGTVWLEMPARRDVAILNFVCSPRKCHSDTMMWHVCKLCIVTLGKGLMYAAIKNSLSFSF